LGLTLTRIEGDDRYPDCCFIEDTAVVFDDFAVLTRPGAPSRRGETQAVGSALRHFRDQVFEVKPPGTLDGGDVLRIENQLYVGISERTNEDGFRQLRAWATRAGLAASAVRVRGALHLKSACTYLGKGCVLLRPGHFDASSLSRFRVLTVPDHEGRAANGLAIQETVLIPAGCPRTTELIVGAGFETIAVDVSEFHKGGGGLTCLSIILGRGPY
jgi:dimethylargininase